MDPEYTTAQLPEPSELLTSVINQLSTIEPESAPNSTTSDTGIYNPLSSLRADTTSKAKSLLLTLHCLFPNELLLALDILDKRLVTKCSISSPGRNRPDQQQCQHQPRRRDVYFVRSQSSLSSAPPTSSVGMPAATAAAAADERDPNSSYEVHLGSWNCTCPAFSLAVALGLRCDDEDDGDNEQDARYGSECGMSDWTTSDGWIFGGALTKQPVTGGRGFDHSAQSGALFARGPLFSAAPQPICCKHLLACVLVARCPRLFASRVREVNIDLGSPSTDGAGPAGGTGNETHRVAAWHAGYG